MNILPLVIPASVKVGVDGRRIYNMRCLHKANIRAFSELTMEAKDYIYDYLFGKMLGNSDQMERVVRHFRYHPTGFAAYLELCDITYTDSIFDAILNHKSEWRNFEKRKVDDLFYASEIIDDVTDVKYVPIVDDPYDSPAFVMTASRTYEPLKILNMFDFSVSQQFDMFAASYMKAAENLYDDIVRIRREKSVDGVFVMYNYNLALPFVYCVRLAVELKIKAALHKIGRFKSKKHEVHDIESLWDSFVSNIPKVCKNARIKNKLSRMRKYVAFLMTIDETGNVSRYPDGSTNKWLDVTLIYENLRRFFGMMDAIDYSVFS